LPSIGKTSSIWFLDRAKNQYPVALVNLNLPLAMVDTQKKSESQEVQFFISGIMLKVPHHCRFEANTGELILLLARRRGKSDRGQLATFNPSVWILHYMWV